MKKTVFTGSAVALVTPFDDKGQVDYKTLAELIGFQLSGGTDAITVCATTGESATLSDKEQKKIIKKAVETIGGKVPVIAGASSNNTSHAIRLAQCAKAAGADAHLQVTPYYNKTTQQGLVAHYYAIADTVDLPMIVYNVPSRTGMNILPQTYKLLSEHPNIVAVKEAGGDVAQAVRTHALCGDELDIYSGDDALTVPMMAAGAKGVISVLANILPAEVHALCKLFSEGFIREATELQASLSDLTATLFIETNPIPVKAAAQLMGLCREKTRLPLTDISPQAMESLKAALKRHKLIT